MTYSIPSTLAANEVGHLGVRQKSEATLAEGHSYPNYHHSPLQRRNVPYTFSAYIKARGTYCSYVKRLKPLAPKSCQPRSEDQTLSSPIACLRCSQ